MAKRRRRFSDIFDEFERIEEEMRRLFEGEFDFDELEEGEPLVYGFSLRVGPEGEPIIEQFGNIKSGPRGPVVSDKREPLVDVIEREEDVTVIAELPGVEKERIRLKAEEAVLTISAEGEEQSYFKRVKLPARVKAEGARATYKNGVLEVVLKKIEKSKPKHERIKIE